jgi:hypothetical protein
LNQDFAADLYMGQISSTKGNTCAYIFTNKTGYPQRGKSSHEAAESLRLFTMDWGIPMKLTVDGAPENVGSKTEFMKQIRQYDIHLHISSPRQPNENPAEGVIREVRKK